MRMGVSNRIPKEAVTHHELRTANCELRNAIRRIISRYNLRLSKRSEILQIPFR